ncbi:MAG TPA: NAD-dependent epimerase/dehydratase family protein, partial [Dissulfuribacter thermophilus]|nr:NAD-dependent epimerase/dehydratase family protein [Dissulfuribacter thermophilus]
MNAILVTGGAGFIGSNFIRLIISETDLSVINLDALTYAGNLENLKDLESNPRYRFVQGRIEDSALVEGLMKEVDACVHFAAESHV